MKKRKWPITEQRRQCGQENETKSKRFKRDKIAKMVSKVFKKNTENE